MLKKLAGHVFVGWIFFGELQGNRQHVQTEHSHPTRAVGLLEVPAGRERGGAVEYADVVEAQEPALENIHSVGVLEVHPPRKVQEQFVKHAFEKAEIRHNADTTLDFVIAPPI